MKLIREHRTQKPILRSTEAFMRPEEVLSHSPSELLTPKVRRKILEIRSHYETGPASERIVPYAKFLTAVRRCWPELSDELIITSRFTNPMLNHATQAVTEICRGEGQSDFSTVNYASQLHYLYTIAFIQPSLLEAAVGKNKSKLLGLLDKALPGTRYAQLLFLVSVLWLGAPDTQPEITKKLQMKSDEIADFARQGNWFVGSLVKLFLPDLDITIPPEKLVKLTRENETELKRLSHKMYDVETSELDARLDSIFSVAVLSATEAKLQPDGTIQYVYAKKPGAQRPLPDRTLT